MRVDAPVLWHLKVSHYNEKARWALDYKRVPHVRRAAVPGRHRAIARRLTGGRTFPVLVLDGQAIGDSTRIIEVLERRYPDPALYPSDPDERRRALEIEEFWDEELGPYTRLLVVHHMLPDPDLTLGPSSPTSGARVAFPPGRSSRRCDAKWQPRSASTSAASGAPSRRCAPPASAFARSSSRAGISSATGSRSPISRWPRSLAPAVAPEQFPYPQPQRGHPLLAPLRDALAAPGLLDWTREMYARWRGPSAELTRNDSAAESVADIGGWESRVVRPVAAGAPRGGSPGPPRRSRHAPPRERRRGRAAGDRRRPCGAPCPGAGARRR